MSYDNSPRSLDHEQRIRDLETLIADLKPRVESIESDLAAIMQPEPEPYDEHGFKPADNDVAWAPGKYYATVIPLYGKTEDPKYDVEVTKCPLTGFALDVLMAVGNMSNGGNGGEMLKPLIGQGKGKTGVVLGNGPSLKQAIIFLDGDDHVNIALNNALARFKQGIDIWLISESQVHRRAEWFYDHTGYAGLTIWDASMVLNGLLEDNAARKEAGQTHYSDEFLGNVVWFLRQGLDGATTGPPEAFRSFDNGLFGYLPLAEVDGPQMAQRYEHGELTGSAAMQAIHLAAGLGCDDIHTYGVELSWPEDSPQHADGLDTFFDDGEPVNRPVGIVDRLSTAYFIDSAAAIRWYCAQAQVNLIDHSGGLLSK